MFLTDNQREELQTEWMNGSLHILCATNAFDMYCNILLDLCTANTSDVVSTEGDPNLGGQNFNQRPFTHCKENFKEINKFKKLKLNDRSESRLMEECESTKIQLSTTLQTEEMYIHSFYKNKNLELKNKRSEFKTINEDHFKRVRAIVGEAVEKARLTTIDINKGIMVDGSSCKSFQSDLNRPNIQYSYKC